MRVCARTAYFSFNIRRSLHAKRVTNVIYLRALRQIAFSVKKLRTFQRTDIRSELFFFSSLDIFRIGARRLRLDSFFLAVRNIILLCRARVCIGVRLGQSFIRSRRFIRILTVRRADGADEKKEKKYTKKKKDTAKFLIIPFSVRGVRICSSFSPSHVTAETHPYPTIYS